METTRILVTFLLLSSIMKPSQSRFWMSFPPIGYCRNHFRSPSIIYKCERDQEAKIQKDVLKIYRNLVSKWVERLKIGVVNRIDLLSLDSHTKIS